jgi:hypothetical protein
VLIFLDIAQKFPMSPILLKVIVRFAASNSSSFARILTQRSRQESSEVFSVYIEIIYAILWRRVASQRWFKPVKGY